MPIIIPAIPFRQRGVRMYVAVVSPADLEQFSIDTWNPKSVVRRRGYQRSLDEGRIKAIAKYFERRDAIMPVAGLLNVRETGRLTFAKGWLTIPNATSVWVVDMQHRLNGLKRANDHRLLGPHFGFPVVIIEGLKQEEEAAQFYIINTRAKKMDVALTRRLLIERNLVKDIADVRPWELKAVQATIALNLNLQSPWRGAIREPNQEKLMSHIATEKSFVASLRQLFLSPWGKSKRPVVVAKRLAVMWNAIADSLPEAFDEPRRYLIQKTPGVFAFNFFLAPELLAAQGPRLPARLARLSKLGANFWKRSNKTGARRFGTGMAGYANLAEHVRERLSL